MNTNDHYTRAKSRLHNGTNNEVIRAQAEATLALAYEKRTANLIAIWSKPEAVIGNVTWGVGEDTAGQLLQEILERLGVKP